MILLYYTCGLSSRPNWTTTERFSLAYAISWINHTLTQARGFLLLLLLLFLLLYFGLGVGDCFRLFVLL